MSFLNVQKNRLSGFGFPFYFLPNVFLCSLFDSRCENWKLRIQDSKCISEQRLAYALRCLGLNGNWDIWKSMASALQYTAMLKKKEKEKVEKKKVSSRLCRVYRDVSSSTKTCKCNLFLSLLYPSKHYHRYRLFASPTNQLFNFLIFFIPY